MKCNREDTGPKLGAATQASLLRGNRPLIVALLALVLTYAGGFWLHELHLAGDGFHAPHGLVDWLRDSTITLPLITLAVWLGLGCSDWLLSHPLHQFNTRYSGVLIVSVIALLTSAAVAGASAILITLAGGLQLAPLGSNTFFCSLAGGAATNDVNSTSLGQIVLRDGALALIANLLLAGATCGLLEAIWRTEWLDRPILIRVPRIAFPHWAIGVRRLRGVVRRFGSFAMLLSLLLGYLPVGMSSAVAMNAAADPLCRNISANVVALDQTIVYNRLGVIDPEGMIFALRSDVVDKTTGLSEATGGILSLGNVQLRSDKRPRPLTLRMNVGDCLTIYFQNLLAPAVVGQIQTRSAGISAIGLQLKGSILSDGSNVGSNATGASPTAGLVAPGGSATYTFYAEREGAYEIYSPSDTVSAEGIGVLAHGLFGAINVEPTGAEWYRSQVTYDDMQLATIGQTPDGHPVIDYDAIYPAGHRYAGKPILKMLDANNTLIHADLTAIITGPGRGLFTGSQPDGGWYSKNPTTPNRNEPFREFTIVFHDEAAVVQAFPQFNDPVVAWTLHGVRDGKGINYGTGGVAAEVLANRLGVGPTANCPECKLEEFFLTSWALGDPAQIVDVPANSTDTNGNLITGPKATLALYSDDPSNVYHSYINDHTKFRNIHVGKEHHIFHLHSHQWLQTPDDDNSSYLDSQAIGPGASYTYEIAYGGSGNRNKTPGDAIFHCHFYPHFAQGMWALWRNHDVFEQGTQLDATGIPLAGARALPDGEIVAGTPSPALVPLPGKPMAPMPAGSVNIVRGQVDLAGPDSPNPDGIEDYIQGWPSPGGNPGYPYYIPGVAGHRPPTPALDMTDPATGMSGPAMDGGLPRHVITGGLATATTTNLDLSKQLEHVTAVYPPEAGTPAELAAMAFHAQPRQNTFFPNGIAATADRGFETNGLPPAPGAPFAEPCRNDDASFNSAAPRRVYKGVDIQLDMKLNKLGWHFPQARMLTLWQDVGPTLSGARAPEPFVMRANSGDCINYYHTNLVPGVYEQDAYQVRTPTDIIGQHIHLVKFDVTSSDGSGNGFNYEDGTLSPDEVRERINAIRVQNNCALGTGAPDDKTCPVAAAHPFFGPGPNNTWLGARTTIQRWWADPVLNNQGIDRTLGNVYTHDHYGPSTHQQTGLYATLLIEPSKSFWRDAETGKCQGDTTIVGRNIPAATLGGCTPVAGRSDGGPTSWRADILTPDNAGVVTTNHDKESFREFYFEFSDFQHAYVANKGATFTNTTITINGTSYKVQVPRVKPDPLYAINPAGAIQNTAVSAAQPWLKVKPTLEGTANLCPANSPLAFSARGCPEAISTADIGTFSMNYRNEPIAARVLDPATMQQAAGPVGDLSLAFKSSDATCKTDEGVPIAGCSPFMRADARLNTQPNFYPPLTADVKPGDPYTPMMRAYEGDRVRIKVQVGATEEGHNASLAGAKWLQEYASPNSGWRNSQMMGISEQFNWDDTVGIDPLEKGNRTDYLFTPDSSVDGIWNGLWGLLRSYSKYRKAQNDLLTLPNNRIDVKGQNDISNLNSFDEQTGYMCPTNATKAVLNVTAVLARDALPNGTLVYNSRTANGGPLHDPTAILYVRTSDLDANGKLKPGVPIEPLILRARAGDCIKLVLQNRLPVVMPDLPGYNMLPSIMDRFAASAPAAALHDTFNANNLRPSNLVGLRPQLVAYEASRGAGNSIGRNRDRTVAPGGQASYWWYAGDLSYNVKTGNMKATPIEFGATNLISSDPIKHSNKGAIGALIIEPQGSTWIEDPTSRAAATVTMVGGVQFRDFVLLFQDDINMRFGVNGMLADGGPVPWLAQVDDAEDSGMKGLNYRSEPLWLRLGLNPAAIDTELMATDFTNALANSQVGGDPQTPIFTAIARQAIRLRVLEPNGHARNHVFALNGHVWERTPYTSSCTSTACVGSTSIGHNVQSQWVGSQEGHGPTDHWDIVPAHGAGGAYGITGDYLYRDMAPLNFYNGLWGLLRVR